MSKFLITGGAGFIEGNFLHIVVRKYQEDTFVCLDALTYDGNIETMEPILNLSNFRFIHGDIQVRNLVDKLFEEEKFNYVINFATESHVDFSIVNHQIFLEINIFGASVLMDTCRKYGIWRYHQISTDEVYENFPLNRPKLMFHENTLLHTSSPYSAFKTSANLPVLTYNRTYGLLVTISQCSNNYRPYQFPEKLIHLMIQNVRDWLHVHNHCTAIDLIVRNERDGEVYNVGGHNERNKLQVMETILHALHKPDSLINHMQDSQRHDRKYAMNPDKIEKELGWKPVYTFETGIQQIIKWNLESRKLMERYGK